MKLNGLHTRRGKWTQQPNYEGIYISQCMACVAMQMWFGIEHSKRLFWDHRLHKYCTLNHQRKILFTQGFYAEITKILPYGGGCKIEKNPSLVSTLDRLKQYRCSASATFKYKRVITGLTQHEANAKNRNRGEGLSKSSGHNSLDRNRKGQSRLRQNRVEML